MSCAGRWALIRSLQECGLVPSARASTVNSTRKNPAGGAGSRRANREALRTEAEGCRPAINESGANAISGPGTMKGTTNMKGKA